MPTDEAQNDVAVEFVHQAAQLLDAAIAKLTHCLGQLTDEQIWHRDEAKPNSIGNLLLHIQGNLLQWGIVPLTKIPDRRDRPSEFDHSEIIPRDTMISQLKDATELAKKLWLGLNPDLANEILLTRKQIQGFDITVLGAITHTASHFVGHTHQIILLTRQTLGEQYQFHWSPELPRDIVPL